jgi:hypothetical protein
MDTQQRLRLAEIEARRMAVLLQIILKDRADTIAAKRNTTHEALADQIGISKYRFSQLINVNPPFPKRGFPTLESLLNVLGFDDETKDHIWWLVDRYHELNEQIKAIEKGQVPSDQEVPAPVDVLGRLLGITAHSRQVIVADFQRMVDSVQAVRDEGERKGVEAGLDDTIKVLQGLISGFEGETKPLEVVPQPAPRPNYILLVALGLLLVLATAVIYLFQSSHNPLYAFTQGGVAATVTPTFTPVIVTSVPIIVVVTTTPLPATETPRSTPTSTKTPTITPTPSNTPTPTNTFTSTPTKTLTPTPTPILPTAPGTILEDGETWYGERFSLRAYNFCVAECGNGVRASFELTYRGDNRILFPGFYVLTNWENFYLKFLPGNQRFVPLVLKGRADYCVFQHANPEGGSTQGGAVWAGYRAPGDKLRWTWNFWDKVQGFMPGQLCSSYSAKPIPGDADSFIIVANIVTETQEEIINARWKGTIPR